MTSEPSEDEREDLWQAIWQTLADHQWADWECSCGGVRKGSGEYEDNHLADVLTDLVAAREAEARAYLLHRLSEAQAERDEWQDAATKARAEAGEQVAQAIEAIFWRHFEPDMAGVDWRDDAAIQAFAAEFWRYLRTIGREVTR